MAERKIRAGSSMIEIFFGEEKVEASIIHELNMIERQRDFISKRNEDELQNIRAISSTLSTPYWNSRANGCFM